MLALIGLVAPVVFARSAVRWKLTRLRDAFADQLPTALQVLASALRTGHSFSGALGVVVENSHEPAQSELRRVAQDEQLGVAPEVALRRMGERMANRDLEQVALLAELQRTAGGNSAEVLDTIVETIRQRGELRRLVRTLTAQGRMARWILTALPFGLTLFLWFVHPDIMGAFFGSSGGQAALLVAVCHGRGGLARSSSASSTSRSRRDRGHLAAHRPRAHRSRERARHAVVLARTSQAARDDAADRRVRLPLRRAEDRAGRAISASSLAQPRRRSAPGGWPGSTRSSSATCAGSSTRRGSTTRPWRRSSATASSRSRRRRC